MFRRRKPASTLGADVATCAATLLEVEAEAGAILSAICAMKVPRPDRMAAVITMLRITPTSHSQKADADFTTSPATGRLRAAGQRCHFREKDERSVNGSRP